MTFSERAQHVAEIVKSAVERTTEEARLFLDQACAGDAETRAEVDSLLKFQAQASGFIEQGALNLAAEALARDGSFAGDQVIGDYKILSKIGAGGMGDVYLAEDTKLRRKVALKLVRAALSTDDIVAKFRHEEQILASLNDPNIAHLYGGGVTVSGIPFFVMEYVEGLRIDEYCDRHDLATAARLALFRKVCSAVHYAHQHLVIHRDLKPSNLLVTEAGEPKLLDFGIAKLLRADESAPAVTLAGVMTPDYASPEQVRGESITTASDVYSLGVIFYELLTGHGPYRVKNRNPGEIARAITDQAPQRPSTAHSPGSRFTSHNSRSLRGDLDNIALMALRKDPARRYASVAQFSEDIRRHLDGLPVTARKDTAGYRASKFVRRNRIGVMAATLVLLSLVGGIIATSWQARVARMERSKAERRFNDVRKLANSYLFELHDAIEKLPGSTPVRELLVKRALEYLDKLAREAHGDVSLQRELFSAYLKVGNVQGNPTNPNLGDTAGALVSYAKATAIAKTLAGADAQSQRPLALAAEKTADVLAITGDITGALKSARESLEVFKGIAQSDSTNAAAQQSLAISYIKLGDISGNPNFSNAGDAAGSLDNYRASLAIWEAQEKLDASNPKVRRVLGVIHERLGTMCIAAKDTAGALDHLARSLAIREALAVENPADADVIRDAALAHDKIGYVLIAKNDLQGALEHRGKSLQIFQRLASADPQNVFAQQSLAIEHLHLGDVLGDPETANLGRTTDALEHYRTAMSILNSLNADKANATTRDTAAEVESKIAKLTRR